MYIICFRIEVAQFKSSSFQTCFTRMLQCCIILVKFKSQTAKHDNDSQKYPNCILTFESTF